MNGIEYDMDRMKAAVDSETIEIPHDLSRDEIIELILSHADDSGGVSSLR